MIAIENCLPHKGSMLFLDRFLGHAPSQKKCQVEVIIQKEKRYLNKDGSFKTHWLIEIMAQAVAGHFHLIKASGGKPKLGFLIGIQNYCLLERIHLVLGDRLVVTSELVAEVFPLGQYEIEVLYQQRAIAKAEMSFVSDEQGDFSCAKS